MALTFPSSPSNGQIYADTTTGNRYIYNATAGVWSFAANNVGMSVSSTPPSNVAPGAMWFNREIGRTFVYYDDGDSKQWIETVPAGAVDTNTIAAYTNPIFASMNGAYTTANAALANTSGTFAGNLSVTGNVGVGAISPTYKLQSNGTFGVTGSAYSNTNVHSSGFSPAADYSNYLAVNIRPDVFTPPIDGQTIYGVNLNPRLSYSGSTSASMWGLNISAEPIDTGNNAQISVRGIQSVAWRQSPTDNTTNTNCSEVGLSTLAGHWWTANSSIKSSSAYGSSFSVYNYTGTITTAYGVYSLVRVGSQANYSASSTNAYGFYSLGQVGAASGTGTGNLTNWYDAYLAGITVSATGTVTNKYGVYQAATGHINYFAGSVGIGTASPSYRLHVSTGTTGGMALFQGSARTMYLEDDGSSARISTEGSGPFSIRAASSGGSHLTIDTSGRVTKPYMPAFSGETASFAATSSTGGNHRSGINYGNQFGWPNAQHLVNNGGNWNTTTGRFTAPVAGYYQFNLVGHKDVDSTGRTIMTFAVNGVETEMVECYGNYQDAGGSVMLYLNANDWAEAGTNNGLRVTRVSFSGFLIG